MTGTAALIFGFLFFLGLAALGLWKYKKRKEKQLLWAAILSLIMAAVPLMVLFGSSVLAVVVLAILFLTGAFALYMILIGPPSSTVVEQLREYDGRLTLRDVLFTWKPLAWLNERVSRFWAAAIYALILSAVCSAVFGVVYFAISGKSSLYTLAGFAPIITVFFFATGYRALIHASGEEESKKTKAAFAALFVIILLLPVLLLIGAIFFGHPKW